MNILQNNITIILFLDCLLSMCNPRLLAEENKPQTSLKASLAMTMAAVQPQNFPIELQATLKNEGKTPISYWSGGPKNYPGADYFLVLVTDQRGITTTIHSIAPLFDAEYPTLTTAEISNGQIQDGAGDVHQIPPASSIIIPIAVSGLRSGKYTIQLQTNPQFYNSAWPHVLSPKMSVKVIEDKKLVFYFQQQLLQKVHEGDDFSADTASRYNIAPINDALALDLGDSESRNLNNAARLLAKVRNPPTQTIKTLRPALEKQAHQDDASMSLTFNLLRIAGRIGTPEALNSVIDFLEKASNTEVRRFATDELLFFTGTASHEELLRLLTDKDIAVKRSAAIALARVKDTSVIPVLITLAEETNPLGDDDFELKDNVFIALASFPNDLRVKTVIAKGTQSKNPFTRQQATQAQDALGR